MSLSLAACKGGAEVIELSGSTMGTRYSVTALDHDGSVDKAALRQAIENSLAKVNAQMSNWDPSSEVSRFNALASTEAMTVSEDLAKVISAAKDIHQASEGQFDITLGPVIEAWGFGAKDTHGHAQPAADKLAAAVNAAGQTDGLRVTGNRISKSRPDTQIYLPSIGKGYGIDQMAQAVRGFGLKDFMVEIGGDLYASGRNADGLDWQIGIESPDAHTRQAYRIASLSNLGMATSGDYRNYFEKDGQRYSHILDARTGRPITHRTASVTVLAESAMLADAWATALLVHGTERGLEIANRRDLAVLFIDRSADAGDKGFVTAASNRFSALQA
ncbi:FAD:protein FMN transferase [Labrenzia aggregata]|uniref:FAD:protein FMN transferase n=2 Tax=Roseibium aggregatum TaxID=187304 RepID=A0A939EA66_9HYPH|nr:FAD:protein FMN transferase [Roseibium aggregatum]